jgi:hypothetical protein
MLRHAASCVVIGLTKIEGLDKLIELRALYLQENLFGRMEGFDHLVHLDTLNLAQNMIDKVEGLDELKKLNTLILKVKHNVSCHHHRIACMKLINCYLCMMYSVIN